MWQMHSDLSDITSGSLGKTKSRSARERGQSERGVIGRDGIVSSMP